MKFICRLLILFFLMNLFLVNIYAQEYYKPYRISNEIKLDGLLNESVWPLAVPISDFMQTNLDPGALPSEKTEVRMLYNDDYLYVGFHCYDNEPEKITRLLMSRDYDYGMDDGISVELDTYNDKTTAVIFITNTLSARFDSEISNNGAGMNNNYNNFWDVVSVMDSTGYFSEFRIPFSSLRFEQKERTIMGFRFARLIKRKNELVTSPRCDSSLKNIWNNVSQVAEMEFSNLKTKKPIYLTPYIIGNFEQQSNLNSDGDAYEKSNTFFTRKYYSTNETVDKIISNLGADLKYGLTKNFTLNVTVNTDFAQAEVDNRIINLSKYAVNLPEKRNFFLEAQNYLSYSLGQNTQVFTSRTIGLEDGAVVPIIGGVRITGRQNGWAIGALNMQTTDVIAEEVSAQNFSVARLRKYYGHRGSFWGGIVTNRISTANNSVSNQSLGIGAVHNINDKWYMGFGAAATYDNNVNNTFDKNSFIYLFAGKNVNEGFSHSLNLEIVGQKFNPAMGFIAETDYGFISLTNGKRTKIGKSHLFNYWSVNTILQYRCKLQSQLVETKIADIELKLDWKKGSSLFFTPAEYKEDQLYESWQINDHILIPVGYYHMYAIDGDFNFDQSKNFTSSFFIRYGDFYGGKLYRLNPSANYIVNRFIQLGINYEFNRINFPLSFSENENTVYISNLIALNTTISLSSKFSIKLLSQYDDINDSYSGNLRIHYNPREGTDLYIVYNSTINSNRLEAKPNLPLIDQQAVVIKYSVTFGL